MSQANSKGRPGVCVTVVGLDMMSFVAIHQLKEVAKVSKIIATDISNFRLEKEMGADVVVNSVEQDPVIREALKRSP